MALTLIVTNAGRAAIVNAQNTGTAPVTVTQIGLSAAVIAPDATAVALAGEFKRIAAVSGDTVADDTIHLIGRDESADVFSMRAFALYLSDGTLLAIYGQPAAIVEKTASSIMLLALDVKFADIDAAALTFGDANFLNPQATEAVKGVAEIATQAESDTGTDDQRIVTPKKARASFLSWMASLFGDVWRASNDGAGSGLDADLLDGQQGSWYSDIIARLGFTPLNATSYTAADVKAKLVTVDGAGSGVDADLLDGQQGSWYADILARLGFTPANRAGDTFTGNISAQFAGDVSLSLNSAGVVIGRLSAQSDGNLVFRRNNGSGDVVVWSIQSQSGPFSFGVPVVIQGNTAWHAGNDGAGSGLDADLLDGLQAANFMRRTVSSWLTSDDGANRFYFEAAGNTYFGTGAGWIFQSGGNNRATIDGAGNASLSGALNTAGNITAANGGALARLQNNGDITAMRVGGTTGVLFLGDPSNGHYLYFDGTNYILGAADLYINGGLAWKSTNDGAGSGLDADLLDGLHASAFAQISQFEQSLGGNGYIKLPGGLIIQWTNVTAFAGASVGVAWPIPFPNSLFAAVPGARQGLTFSGSYSAYLTNVSNVGATVWGNNGSGAASTVSIIAIGN